MENTLDPRVHDMTIAQTARFSLSGQATPITRVTYFIGAYGPFSDDYPTPQYSAAAVKAGVQRHIDVLEELGTLAPAQPTAQTGGGM